ncbi:MAG: UPF0149 family protein [Polaromonas sp.]
MNDFFDYNLRHPLPQKSQRLSEAQCDELFSLFDDPSLPATTLSAEMADGYLTACVVGPTPVPAHEWMEGIFGQPELPVFDHPGHQRRLLELLQRRHRDITTATSIDLKDITKDSMFVPLRGEVPADEIISPYQLDKKGHRKGEWDGKDWAEGFRRAMVEDPLWKVLIYDRESAVLLVPVMIYQQGYNPDKREVQIEQQPDLFAQLIVCVSKIRKFWSSYRPGGTFAPLVRDAQKVGRNDPCPCGSGKKYKKCCGA